MSSTVTYVAACTLSLLISSGIAFVAWQRRREPGAFPFFVLAAGQASWTYGIISETISPTLEEKIFWDNFQFFGWMLASTVVIIFAYEFSQMQKNVKRFWWVLAYAITIGTVILVYTDPMHRLIRPTAELNQEYDFVSLTYPFTNVMFGLSIYSYLTIIVATAILLLHVRKLPREQRPQIWYIIAGLILPIVGGVFSFTDLLPAYLRDISPFTFGAGNALIAVGLMRYQLFEVSRFAKEQVIETMETAVIATETRGYVSFANPVAMRMFGFGNEMVGRLAPLFVQGWFEQVKNESEQGISEHIVQFTSNGKELSFAASAVTLHDNRGNAIGSALILNDITGRVQTEKELSERTRLLEEQTEVIRQNQQQLEESNQRALNRASQLQALTDVSRAVASINDLELLLPTITRVISDGFGFYHVGIFMTDDVREFAVLSAANSEGGQNMLKRGHKLRIGQAGIVGTVVASGVPRIALDTGTDAAFLKNPDLPNTRSEMALPLRAGHEIIGALDVQSTEPSAFSNEDVETLTTLADQVSIAIQNARLFEEMMRSAAENQVLVQQYARSQWSGLVKAQKKIGYRYSGKVEELTAKVKSEPTELTTQVPIMVRGQVIGTMTVRPGTDRSFTEDELDIIHAATERAAIAAENARLLDDAQRRVSTESAISNLSAKISEAGETQRIMATTVSELQKLLGASEVSFQLSHNE